MYPRYALYHLLTGLYLGSSNGRQCWVQRDSEDLKLFDTATEASAVIPSIPRRMLPRRPHVRVLPIAGRTAAIAKGGA